MKYRYRLAGAAGAFAAIAIAAAAFAAPPSSPTATGAPHPQHERGDRMGRLVHSETKVQTPDGTFTVLTADAGTATAINGSTVTIKRLDDQSVSATATDATKVRRNGKEAKVSDIKAGDMVFILRAETNGTTTVRAIKACSKEAMDSHSCGHRHRHEPGAPLPSGVPSVPPPGAGPAGLEGSPMGGLEAAA
ncbi:MAG: hypothetical protein NVSMB57_17310 [Actinomycetota bacterium]